MKKSWYSPDYTEVNPLHLVVPCVDLLTLLQRDHRLHKDENT